MADEWNKAADNEQKNAEKAQSVYSYSKYKFQTYMVDRGLNLSAALYILFCYIQYHFTFVFIQFIYCREWSFSCII